MGDELMKFGQKREECDFWKIPQKIHKYIGLKWGRVEIWRDFGQFLGKKSKFWRFWKPRKDKGAKYMFFG